MRLEITIAALQPLSRSYIAGLERRAAAVPAWLARKLDRIALGWMLLITLLAIPAALLSITPAKSISDYASLLLPYLYVATMPVAGIVLAQRAFPNGLQAERSAVHFSVYGRWRKVSTLDARANPDFGPAGFIASLLIGLLLNVAMRTAEFLMAVPALSQRAPEWGQALFHTMAADVAIMGFFYMVCFVMALRAVPYFPKMLLFTWGLDILMQLLIAARIGPMEGLPTSVAGSLQNLLHGNISKVLISGFVWLPYLILSERVNVTYRRRVRLAKA